MCINKKIIPIIMLTVLVVSVLGCGSQDSISSDNASDYIPYSKSITIAARDGSYSDVINAVIKEFEMENSCHVDVISLNADDIHDTVIDDRTSESGIYDVIMIDDPLMPEYIEKGILFNLTKLGYSDDDDFVEKSRLLGKDPYPLGATYALPFSGNVQLIFYNEDVLGENPDLSNWESIYQACLLAKESGKLGYALRGQAGNPIVSDFLPILWAFGGDVFDKNNHVSLDSDESRKALEFYCQLYQTGAKYDRDSLITAVNTGEAGIALGWPSWFISGTGSMASISQIPGKASNSAVEYTTGEIGNWLLGVTSNSSEKELALKLTEYLTSAEVQREALKYGGVPTRKSIFRDSAILNEYPYFEYIYSGTNNSRVRPRTTKWSRIEEVFGAELLKCIDGEQSVDDTITKSHAAIEALASE